MSDEKRSAARVLMVGLEGERLDAAGAEALRELRRPAGLILFARNLAQPEDLRVLVDDVSRVLGAPFLLALDQEGGRVSRLRPWVGHTPTAAELAHRGEAAVRRFGQATASALRALGFGLDFAPVVDLCPPTAENGVGDRSWGTDPGAVTRLAGAFLDELAGRGVAGCLKHFPGLGDTAVDSHLELPTCFRDRRRLEDEDLVPFLRLASRAPAVMVGHAYYPALDPERGPASLSAPIVRGLLRERLGYRGLVVTDDLEMGAVAPLDRAGSAAVAAVGAGCDLLLYCHDLGRAILARDALATRAGADPDFAERLNAASAAVDGAARRWGAVEPDLTAWARAREEIAAASEVA